MELPFLCIGLNIDIFNADAISSFFHIFLNNYFNLVIRAFICPLSFTIKINENN